MPKPADHSLLALVFLLAVTPLVRAVGPPPGVSPPPNSPAYKDPKTTFATYIEATRKNDLPAARRCWVIDDNNRSGALDVVVGLWISMREINQLVEKKFGKERAEELLKGWARDDVSDAALDLTKKLLAKATVTIQGGIAKLKINWEKGTLLAEATPSWGRPRRSMNGG
jgi:hypothetical protein